MQFDVEIKVMPLKELLDPQGKAVEHSLNALGFGATHVRIGKHISLKIEAENKAEAQKIAEEAAKKVLHNPVMEYFEVTILA